MLVFLKLGGSLITDKSQAATFRPDVAARLAEEIAAARAARPDLQLLIGHGSGSFGHYPATVYRTAEGVRTPDQWRGYAEVGTVAARLNRLMTDTLRAAGLPILSLQPSASAVCRDGAPVFIGADLAVRGSGGYDRVTYNSSNDTADRQDVTVETTHVTGLGGPAGSFISYDGAVEEVELLMGLGNDRIVVPDLTRRVTVHGAAGEDEVIATLLGKPTGGGNDPAILLYAHGGDNDPAVETFGVEEVTFFNEDNAEATDWLITDEQLRSGVPGVFEPQTPGFYDQLVLRTHDALE